MNTRIFDVLKKWLEKQYSSHLGISLEDVVDGKREGARWYVVNKGKRLCAYIVDYDIGLMLNFYFINNVEKIKIDVDEDIQAAMEWVTELQPKYGLDEEKEDVLGNWQVGVLWLMPEEVEADWRQYIAELRSESGFSEELSLDMVSFSNEGELETSLNQHKLPTLLLNTRGLFNLRKEEMPAWLTANLAVKSMLQEFPNRFEDIEIQELAVSVVDSAISSEYEDNKILFPSSPKAITSLAIENCRNITSCSLELSKDFNDSHVDTHVVFGPNGSGKSTLFEALSFGMAGTSSRHVKYIKDKDVSRGSNYIAEVLAPLNGGTPKIMINGEACVLSQISHDENDVERKHKATEGNLLAQEDSSDFVKRNSNELGALILSGYSTLAEHAQYVSKTSYDKSNAIRQEWLRRYGLSSNITRQETRLHKLIEYVLGSNIPSSPLNFLSWLSKASHYYDSLQKSNVVQLAGVLESVDSEKGRDQLKKSISPLLLLGEKGGVGKEIYKWLEKRNSIVIEIKNALEDSRSEIDLLKESVEVQINELEQWGEWLLRQSDMSTTELPIEDNTKTLILAIEELRKENEKLIMDGKSIRQRFDHVDSVRRDFLQTWAGDHVNECPTCAADHEASGGIVKVVDDLFDSLQGDLDEKRRLLRDKTNTIKDLETKLATLGHCPVSKDRRNYYEEKLLSLVGESTLPTILVNRASRERLKNDLHVLSVLPALPAVYTDTEVLSNRISMEIAGLNDEGERIWSEPAKWKKVHAVLQEECRLIVEKHLPNTLEAVWSELVMALTSARWNIVGVPHFETEIRRGNEQLMIKVGSESRQILARYLFNQAEQHVLGLAWFFTRYFTDGRFRFSLVALDDCAQEMDQTTFRSFTRFISCFQRLHKSKKQPLSILLFLHQEDRALDVSRATNADFNMINWEQNIVNDDARPALKKFKLLSEEFKLSVPDLGMQKESEG